MRISLFNTDYRSTMTFDVNVKASVIFFYLLLFFVVIYKRNYLSSIAIIDIGRLQQSQLKPEIRI